MKYLLTTLTTILAFGMLIISMPVLAQTPDGDTPAQETVCDPLKADGITKGLYGLCVAFCEAHDAADIGNPLTESQLSDILELSPNGRILKNYNKKMQAGDPDMPCVNVQEPCPCWTADHIAAIDGIAADGTVIVALGLVSSDVKHCAENGPDSNNLWNATVISASDNVYGPGTGFCQGYKYKEGVGWSDLVTLWYYGEGDTNNTLTIQQRDACVEQIDECISRVCAANNQNCF